MKVLDLTIVGDDNVYQASPADIFEYSDPSSWYGYIVDINVGNLDGIHLTLGEIDRRVFVIDDGGELIRLRDGTYLNVCWRGKRCRVWEEDDPDRVAALDAQLGICYAC